MYLSLPFAYYILPHVGWALVCFTVLLRKHCQDARVLPHLVRMYWRQGGGSAGGEAASWFHFWILASIFESWHYI